MYSDTTLFYTFLPYCLTSIKSEKTGHEIPLRDNLGIPRLQLLQDIFQQGPCQRLKPCGCRFTSGFGTPAEARDDTEWKDGIRPNAMKMGLEKRKGTSQGSIWTCEDERCKVHFNEEKWCKIRLGLPITSFSPIYCNGLTTSWFAHGGVRWKFEQSKPFLLFSISAFLWELNGTKMN